MIEQTFDDYLNRMAIIMDDFAGTPLTTAADGRLGRARCVGLLNAARRSLFRSFLAAGVTESIFTEREAITADATDTDRFDLPKRRYRLVGLFDENDNPYSPVYSRLRARRSGYLVEGDSIRWWLRDPPSTTVYAVVVKEPAHMTQGTAAAGDAVSITFATTPDLGYTVAEDDYYKGARIAIVSGTGSGQVATITDWVGSTLVATAAFSPALDNTSVYCVMDDLPRCMGDAIILKAAVNLCRVDKTFKEVLPQFYGELKEAQESALAALKQPASASADGPRHLIGWHH